MADQVMIVLAGAGAEVSLKDGRRLGFAEYGDAGGVPCFYFHFAPGSRLDPAVLFARCPAALAGIRLIAVDRPGFGRSDRQPGRGFADFPADVLAVADRLGVDRFAVLGLSGGGGYALACACLIPERVSVAVVVSGMPSVSRPQDRRALAMGNRVLYRLAGPVPWLVQPIMTLLFRLMIRALRRPGRPARREDMGLPFPPDVLADPQLRPLVIADLTEAVIRARSGALAARIGPRLQMSIGPILIGAGLALAARIGPSGSYLTDVLPGVLVFGLGLAATVAPLTSTALAAAPSQHAGIASAINNDVARAAGLIAVAVLPAAAGITGYAYQHPSAFDHGFTTAVLLAAAICALGGGLAAITIRNPPGKPSGRERPCFNCAVDASALIGSTEGR